MYLKELHIDINGDSIVTKKLAVSGNMQGMERILLFEYSQLENEHWKQCNNVTP